jgi:HAD superfamily hydrolase (TIGR01459 family)
MPSHFLSGLETVVDRYDAFVIDLWGVMHDGCEPYPDALTALQALKDLKKTTLLLSNSPRRVSKSREHLANMGIPQDLYTHLYTSGEDTHIALKDRPHQWHQKLGDRLYHIGPAMHHFIYTGLPYGKMASPQEADFILTTGAESPRLKDYEVTLRMGIDGGLPMLCANPDRIVVHGGELTLCCGAIAEEYERLGGNVFYHGKPYAAVYQPVLSLLNGITPSRILAIGDSLTTDIQGAQTVGMDSALIMSGIHHETLLPSGHVRDETNKSLQSLTEKLGITPNYALQMLRW